MLQTILNDIAPIIIRHAPLLATTLVSPLAGAAVEMICDAFGVDPSKPEELLESIKNDPIAQDKLQALEQVHRAKMKSFLGLNELKHAEIIIKLDWQPDSQTSLCNAKELTPA